MPRRWVVNASPLILLGKVDRLELLSRLADEIVVPAGVLQEVQIRPDGESSLEKLLADPKVRVEETDSIQKEIEVWDLGQGESEVLARSLAVERSRAVLDDREARRCAQALDIAVIGTLGVVLRAKQQGLIPAARPVMTALRRVGLYVSDELVEKVLLHLGE